MRNRFKIKRLSLRYILPLFIISTLSACDKQTVYYTFQALPAEGWPQKDTLLFDVEVPDSLTYYKLSVAIRNRSDYPYQNLNLSVSYNGLDSISYPAHALQLTLADQEGRWKGKGWGNLYQSSFSAGSIRIGKPGLYRFKIVYTLPDSVLWGINDLGIKLER